MNQLHINYELYARILMAKSIGDYNTPRPKKVLSISHTVKPKTK